MPNGEIEFFTLVHFNSTTKTLINHKVGLFQEIVYRIDNWTIEGSGWIVKLIMSQYINISTYRPLLGTSYIKLPAEIRSPKKRANQHQKKKIKKIKIKIKKIKNVFYDVKNYMKR